MIIQGENSCANNSLHEKDESIWRESIRASVTKYIKSKLPLIIKKKNDANNKKEKMMVLMPIVVSVQLFNIDKSKWIHCQACKNRLSQ